MELYKDPKQPVEKRVEDLLSRMTLEEKVAQLCGDLAGSFIVDGKVSVDSLREKFPNGHGRFTQFSIVGLVSPEQIAEIANTVQDYFVKETRLGIPVALQTENLCGYPAAKGTLFPAQINMGCTWEPELAEQMASVIGQESRSVGLTSAMSPVIDVSRDPRWGRTYETYGEDPYVISQFGINYIRGMQKEGVSCIAKHFLGYAETQGGLNTAAARINDRELYEVFATPFEAADKEAHVGAMMANYGEIDGMPVITNKHIARELLREKMGFKGILTSDGAAVLKLYTYYKQAESYKACGLLAKKGGCDTEIPVGGAFRQLPDYVRSGELDEALIDESVRRVLTVKFETGLFENPYCDVSKVRESMNNPEKSALSYKIARDSLVLLKNDGILPLKAGKKVAVIGPHADSLRYPVSGYTYPAYIEMIMAGAKGEQTSFNGIADEAAKNDGDKKQKDPFSAMFDIFSDADKAKLDDMNTVLRQMGATSLKEELANRTEITYAKGCDIIGQSIEGFDEAVAAAEKADVVVMALGGNSGWVNVTGGEGKDRQVLDLPGVQEQLLEAVTAVGKPVVVVLYGPGVFSVNWADRHCNAIVQAFMPGQFAAKAVSDVLYGDVNPGGKLTMSIPRGVGQVPIFYYHKNGSGYRSGGDSQSASSIFSGGYVDGPSDPLYCFGHGLSYTRFQVSDLKLESLEVPTDGMIEAEVSVANVGDVIGDETVQLYTSFYGAHVTRPNIQLAGFKRLTLAPGEKKTVKFHLNTAQLGYYNEDMEFVVEPGKLTVSAGTSSNDLPLKQVITLTGKKTNVMGRRAYTCPVDVE